MPHQCVRCGKLYDDGSEAILKGCTCGAKLFFFVKKSAMKKIEEAAKKLSEQDKEQIEKDVYELIGEEIDNVEQPIVLDIESINITEPGKYELDLVHLFSKQPLVYKLEEGKYMIDIAETFKNVKDADVDKDVN
ncbi:hypothetical protein JXM83_05715 [Candidatus Woesearchaeota archaeon]|nr:hypothetical protein [Candidatus Woesearchaeota archaeon]